jgi:thymidylate synthase (FAD)
MLLGVILIRVMMQIAQIEAKLIDAMGTDLSVVNAARVSFDKESDWECVEVFEESGEPCPLYFEYRIKEGDEKLIHYLAKHKHFSPFNHTFLSFRIKAPIFVARQLVKHRFMPWNEVSRRYVDSEPEFYISEHFRKKAENVKQGSSEEDVDNNIGVSIGAYQITKLCLNQYKWMMEQGVCAEQARGVLPLWTMTEWIWSGTLGAFADMLRLRLDPHTQYESRIVANLIKPQIEERFPISLNALLAN